MISAFRAHRNVIFLIFFSVILYVATRTYHLTALPIFTDEAIYIRWSQIGSRDSNWRFISLVDGKQPLFTWIMMILMRILPDPLFAGRFVSVLAGFGSLIALWLITQELFQNKRLSVFAGFLYLTSPFYTLYDRMALYDSLVVAFFLWSFYVAVLLVRHLRLDTALILGMVLGGGMLNKTSGFLSLYLLPTTLILFDWDQKRRTMRLLKWIALVVISGALSFAMYNVLRLSPLFHMISQKDNVFIYSLQEWLRHPLLVLVGNVRGMFDWLRGYFTFPIFVASFVAFLRFTDKTKVKILLGSWWFFPFLALGLFGKVLYPRFILFMTVPFLILAAYSIDWFFAKWGKTLFGFTILSAVLFPSVYATYLVVTNPLYAPIPQADRGQFIDDWPSGWGIKEVNSFLQKEAISSTISVYTEGTFGLLPYAVEMYLVDNPHVTINGIWPLVGKMPETMVLDATKHPTYLVLNLSQAPPNGWNVALLAAYQKGLNQDVKLRLYQVLPQSSTIEPR